VDFASGLHQIYRRMISAQGASTEEMGKA